MPPLEFGLRPELSSKGLYELLEETVPQKELYVWKLWIDLSNIHALLAGGLFDSRGNYSRSTIRALLASEDGLPEYVFEFLRDYEGEEKRREAFSALIAKYFQEEMAKHRGYGKRFLAFEHDMRVLLAGYRAHKLKRDIAWELQYEDMSDPVVYMTLMQKDVRGAFQFPIEYEELERILAEAGSDPTKQYEGIARYRFAFYNQIFIQNVFSLEGIIAYMMALWILEDLYALEREEGEKQLRNMVEREHVS